MASRFKHSVYETNHLNFRDKQVGESTKPNTSSLRTLASQERHTHTPTCSVEQAKSVGLSTNHHRHSIVVKHLQGAAWSGNHTQTLT